MCAVAPERPGLAEPNPRPPSVHRRLAIEGVDVFAQPIGEIPTQFDFPRLAVPLRVYEQAQQSRRHLDAVTAVKFPQGIHARPRFCEDAEKDHVTEASEPRCAPERTTHHRDLGLRRCHAPTFAWGTARQPVAPH